MTPLVSMFTGNPGSKSPGPVGLGAKHFESRTETCSRPAYCALFILYGNDVCNSTSTDTWLSC